VSGWLASELEAPMDLSAQDKRTPEQAEAMAKLMGLAVFGEKGAARIYHYMGKLKPEHHGLMHEFAQMEGSHGTWFMDVARRNGIEPDRAFADKELGYLTEQVEAHYAAQDFDALAILQGFIVECMAISTFDSFLNIADHFDGAREPFAQALADERYHVDWITKYLQRRFEDRGDEFTELAERVNAQGVDCVGGSMMNIVDYLGEVGLEGADCAGVMMDEYTQLLENVGVEPKRAAKNVVSLFMPLIRQYRHGEEAHA
jgi:rubrerythrin